MSMSFKKLLCGTYICFAMLSLIITSILTMYGMRGL
jgi:hypothetical protein